MSAELGSAGSRWDEQLFVIQNARLRYTTLHEVMPLQVTLRMATGILVQSNMSVHLYRCVALFLGNIRQKSRF